MRRLVGALMSNGAPDAGIDPPDSLEDRALTGPEAGPR
jgi:hypothetical protein